MKATDVDFLRLALSRGGISQKVHDAALGEADRLQALGLDKSVDEILLERDELTPEEVRNLREALGWALRSPRVGDYEVLRRIGIGGMGTVFEARHVRLKQRIALKILFPRLARDREIRERFLREARTLGRLNNPHLVHAIDAGRDGGYCYLAMEYVEGENLQQLLGRGGPLQAWKCLEIVEAVCGALQALEEKGLVHCDVKPANILLGKRGVVKLADLGLLKAVDERTRGAGGLICGTPHYLSPEQAWGRERIDSRSDLYSLAATWFHMLAGQPPFVGNTTKEILEAHAHQPPPSLSAFRPEVARATESTLKRWLAKDPDERPANCVAALQELSALRNTRVTVPEGPLPITDRLKRGASRRSVLLLGLSLLFLAVVILFASSFFRDGGEEGGRREQQEPVAAQVPGENSVNAMEAPPAKPPREVSREGSRVPREGDANSRAKLAPPSRREESGGEPPATAASREALGSLLQASFEVAELIKDKLDRAIPRAIERGVEGLQGFLPRGQGARAGIRPVSQGPLAESFHATATSFGRAGETGPRLTLLYQFDRPEELDDFRAAPGAWHVRDGILYSQAQPSGWPFETVAWFVPPLQIEGELEKDSFLILGLGNLRILPGQGRDARWWLATEEPRELKDENLMAFLPKSTGAFSVLIQADRVEVRTPSDHYSTHADVPEKGRFALYVPPGSGLKWLKLEGELHPLWARERLKLLVKEGESRE